MQAIPNAVSYVMRKDSTSGLRTLHAVVFSSSMMWAVTNKVDWHMLQQPLPTSRHYSFFFFFFFTPAIHSADPFGSFCEGLSNISTKDMKFNLV